MKDVAHYVVEKALVSTDSLAERICRLYQASLDLAPAAVAAGASPLEGQEWFELLRQKLVPQLSNDSFLIAAVVGGTNIGKSVIFNHLAGFRASASSPLASGTRHPTCLIPEGFREHHDLHELFPGFELTEWASAEQTLVEDGVTRLFWRVHPACPKNLLILDTPDVDSDARINWERADHIRRCADVLIAVLTQQKYNDAAVKEFFRQAAAEDKLIVLIFNQCLLPEDEPYWPLWLETFCRETGVKPEILYVAPNDRRAAEEIRLPFFVRSIPGQEPAEVATDAATTTAPRSLLEEFSRTRFAEIKRKTLAGAVRQVCDETAGAGQWLLQITRKATEHQQAANLLTARQLAEIDHWPPVPNAAMVGQIREWWRGQRQGLTAKVHGFYNSLSSGLTKPLQYVAHRMHWESPDPWKLYQQQEWLAIVSAVEKVFDKLTFISQLGNDLLKPRLQQILSGVSREKLLETLRTAHQAIDHPAELATLVATELAQFREESPQSYELFRRLDVIAAAVRPATSVVLFMTGIGPVGHALSPALTDTAMQSVLHVASDFAGGTVAAAVGDTMLSTSASTGIGYLEARFRKLHALFTAHRAAWLAGILKTEILGTLPEELHRCAALATDARVEQIRLVLAGLRS